MHPVELGVSTNVPEGFRRSFSNDSRLSGVGTDFYSPPEFEGGIIVFGRDVAMKIGGFVKMSVATTFDPLGSDDRFVVATIPVDEGGLGDEARTSFSAQQSRINIDLREASSAGDLRAFVEFDFAGDSDGARLRHASGQYRSLLAGQTWSTLVDRQALPEEIDFEGVHTRTIAPRQLEYGQIIRFYY